MKIKVIYHRADFDGIFCREIARKFLPQAELIGWDYGDPEPVGIESTDLVYILDLSVPSLMDHPKLIWIDHHKSAMEKYPATISGYRIDGVAACRLTWQWFQNYHEWDGGQEGPPFPVKQEYVDRTVREPMAVRLAGEYDIWDKRDPNAELFQHGLRSRELEAWHWAQLLDDTVSETLKGTGMEQTNSELFCCALLESGKTIQYVKTKENESIISRLGFTFQWEGLTFLGCNHAVYNSLLFSAGLKPEHDACFGFKWDGSRWLISLYHAPGKEHHDLSLIATKYGGGGHRGACGFRTEILPFL